MTGERVLLVDADPQANATSGLGIPHDTSRPSLYDVLLKEMALEEVVEPTTVKNLFVVPSSIDLAGAEIEMVGMLSREHQLRKALESLETRFDFAFIDCPPSLGLITVNALTAAGEVLIPIQCEYFALEGLSQLLRNIAIIQQNINPELEIEGVVLTMLDRRTTLGRDVSKQVREHFGEKAYKTAIPRTVRLAEAPSFGEPITSFDRSSRGAVAYRALAAEFRRRHGRT